MMRYLSIAAFACLLALPAAAQYVAPKYDEAGCVALAERMDEALKAKQAVPADDQEQFELCIGFFNCDELAAAANAEEVPREAISTNAKAMRYTLRSCGNTSEVGQEPPDPKKTAPGSAFGGQPRSAFP